MKESIRQDRLLQDIQILKKIISFQLHFEFKLNNFHTSYEAFKIENNISLKKNYYKEVNKRLKYYSLEINYSYSFKERLNQLQEVESKFLLYKKLNQNLTTKNIIHKKVKI